MGVSLYVIIIYCITVPPAKLVREVETRLGLKG
jgi:hypothetical protein